MSDATPIRDPETDSLLTPQNAVLTLIDYQPEQYAGVKSVGHDELLAHVTMLGRVATAFEVPVVLSTVYVKHGMSGTNPELREAFIKSGLGEPPEEPEESGSLSKEEASKIVDALFKAVV